MQLTSDFPNLSCISFRSSNAKVLKMEPAILTFLQLKQVSNKLLEHCANSGMLTGNNRFHYQQLVHIEMAGMNE